MARDRTLSEFATGNDIEESGEHSTDDDVDSPAATTGAEATESSTVGTDDVTPIEPTYETSATGEPCPVCGEAVSERWRDGDGMVCADCKEW